MTVTGRIKRKPRSAPTAGRALRAAAQVIDGVPAEHAYPEPQEARKPGEGYIARETPGGVQRTHAQLPLGVTGRIMRRR